VHSDILINPLTPNDPYRCRTAPLTSKRCILYISSKNIGTKYFKHGIYAPFYSLQNAVCSIILTYLVPVLFTSYIQGVLLYYSHFIYRVCSCIIHILYTECASALFTFYIQGLLLYYSHFIYRVCSCIIHILYTGVLKLKKKFRRQKVK
jgi:hypothetical protein